MSQSYAYDKLNRLTSVSENGQVIAAYTYDNKGNRTQSVSNGETTNYTYNLANMLTSQVTGEKLSEAYTYYLNGNQKTKVSNGETTTYTYDGMNRLVSENDTLYTFDDFGNRATMTDGEATTSYTYDLNNRLTESIEVNGDITTTEQYFYDNNGNQISKVVSATHPSDITGDGDYSVSDVTDNYVALYEYNCYNQLVYANTDGAIATYTYAPDGLRASKSVGDVVTMFVYDSASIIEEIVGADTNKYYRGIGIIKNGDGLYYLYNGQGDVAMLTNADGTVVASYTFDAYGNAQQENEVYNPFGYRGEYADSETGFIYLRARYYDPSTGRFINEDPIRDGLNWYVYCGNNPVLYVDPSGLAIKLAGTTDERRELLGYLQSLTNDTLKLTFDENDDCWVYYETNGEKNKPAGTNLVREIINHKHLVEISVEKKNDSMDPGVGKTRFVPDSQSDSWIYGKGSGGKLYLNREIINVELEDGTTENMSNEIRIGHELVHAYDSINGLRMPIVNNVEEYGAYYHNKNKVYRSGTASINELRTVGLSYINSLSKCVYASSYVYSENILREEQGLKKRISY